MSNSLYLGIDCGTESTRAVLFDAKGNQLAQASIVSANIFPQAGYAEQKPEDTIRQLIEAVKACCSNLPPDRIGDIVSLCVDGTCSTVIFSSFEGKPLRNAILWMDTRAVQETLEIEQTKHPLLRYAGGEDAVEWLIPKALWVKKNQPDVYRCADVIAESTDYVNHWLTGRWTASICNATDAWNYVSVEGGFSIDFFEAIGAPELLNKLPSCILPLGTCIGNLREEAADALGLPAGTMVAQGGIDAHLGYLGLGVEESGILGLTIGSSSVHLVYSDQPKFVKGIWGPYPDIILPRKWLMQGGQSSTGSALKWFRDNFSPSANAALVSGSLPYDELDKMAIEVPPGANGLTIVEHFQGNRTPFRDALSRGTMFGMTLATTEADVFRALRESAAFGTKLILETLRAGGVNIHSIIASGGGTRSNLWMQIHADVCGLPIKITNTQNVSALGCAMCGAVAAGQYRDLSEAMTAMKGTVRVIEPDLQSQELYIEPYYKYIRAYQAMRAFYHYED